MKLDEFVSAYRRRQQPIELSIAKTALPAASVADLVQTVNIAAVWGDLLHDRLAGRDIPAYAEYARFLDDDYAPWANTLFGHVLQAIDGVRLRFEGWSDEPRSAPLPADLELQLRDLDALLTASRFHLLQRFAQAAWLLVLYPQIGTATPEWIEGITSRARTSQARQAVDLAELRDLVRTLEATGSGAARALRQTMNGVLAELDASIALWELFSRHAADGVVVVPAPPQFEQWAGAANADFLVLDLHRGHARGIQVKSTLRGVGAGEIDQERLLLLHVAEDLDGFHILAEPDAAGETRVPWTGSLALRYLSVARYHERLKGHLSESEFFTYKARATALLPVTISEEGRRANELADLAARARRATAARPARPPSAQERIRQIKQRERARFDHTAEGLYRRVTSDLYL